MSLFDDLARVFSSAAGRDTTKPAGSYCGDTGRIDRLCRELGWSVDERDGEKIRLHFNDPLTTIRKVYIHGGDDALVNFTVFSAAILPQDEVPQQVIGHLLRQNNELGVGAWEVYVDEEDDDAMFSVRYCALGDGLTADSLKYICEKLIAEAAAFDKKMLKAGLLRLS